MLVKANLPDAQALAIMKLFDACYSPQLRKGVQVQPWSTHNAEDYLRFVRDGHASRFASRLRETPTLRLDEGDDWSQIEKEVYLHQEMRRLYRIETAVYHRLDELQGKDVPRLLDRFTLFGHHSPAKEPFECPGIILLLQYIEGYSLKEIRAKVPSSDWQHV